KIDMKLTSIKDASQQLLEFTTEEKADTLIKEWLNNFLVSKNNDTRQLCLYFVLHELLHRSLSRFFVEKVYDSIAYSLEQISDNDNLQNELLKLFKLWIQHDIYQDQFIIRLIFKLKVDEEKKIKFCKIYQLKIYLIILKNQQYFRKI
ncbi:hypothetical protein IMG5_188640, partial [Ichthyophthirius multifiliis]